MSLQHIIGKRGTADRTGMEFPNRPQEHGTQSRQNLMTTQDTINVTTAHSGTPGIVHIGNGVKVTGTFEACDIAEIHGSLDGEIQTRELIIHEGGQLTGMAICKIARISGRLEGEIEASELLQIQNTGRVDGKIGYARLVIEDGGLIKGEVSPNKNRAPQDLLTRPITNPKNDKAGDKNPELSKDDVAAA
tara:strand:- start:416 stop:985 length:570 start_codon:yes stop_codon:yes gene_type:complete